MISEKTTAEDILTMPKGKGNICISVILPTHRLSPDRRADQKEAERAINIAKQSLRFKFTESDIRPLEAALDELFDEIDFMHNAEGLGLYVSPGIKLSEQFAFPVEEKVMVGDNFEIRDLLYKANYADPYYVLLLTQKKIQLFRGEWKELDEINDSHFPQEYKEEYLYNPPSQSTSYSGYAHEKGFEKDKSELEEIRFKAFFRHADESLNNYLAGKTPLILLGNEKELAWFRNISKHGKCIINKKAGSYSHSNEKQLADMAWPMMLSHWQHKREELVKEFEEKIGEGLGVKGIQDIWKAAAEGKALKLLVEKDYRCPGFVEKGAYHLFLHPPLNAHRIIADAVDDIIEMVLEKNGDVFFVDNGTLQQHQQMALITRY